MRKIIGFSKNLNKFTTGRTSEADNRGKFFSLVQPVAFWKANNTVPQEWSFKPCEPASQTLYPKANPSLGPARPDNSGSASGFHTNPKAMGPFSASHGWLVSTFHLSPEADK
jgi:hypothetical protein